MIEKQEALKCFLKMLEHIFYDLDLELSEEDEKKYAMQFIEALEGGKTNG